MNRRTFLKYIGLSAILPNKVTKSTEISNGQIYQAPWPLCHRVIVQYFGRNNYWLLLSNPYESANRDGTAMMVCYYEREDGSYNPLYTKKELAKKLSTWQILDGHRVTMR